MIDEASCPGSIFVGRVVSQYGASCFRPSFYSELS